MFSEFVVFLRRLQRCSLLLLFCLLSISSCGTLRTRSFGPGSLIRRSSLSGSLKCLLFALDQMLYRSVVTIPIKLQVLEVVICNRTIADRNSAAKCLKERGIILESSFFYFNVSHPRGS